MKTEWFSHFSANILQFSRKLCFFEPLMMNVAAFTVLFCCWTKRKTCPHCFCGWTLFRLKWCRIIWKIEKMWVSLQKQKRYEQWHSWISFTKRLWSVRCGKSKNQRNLRWTPKTLPWFLQNEKQDGSKIFCEQ